jgi:UDP-MurNAc hydroxylase
VSIFPDQTHFIERLSQRGLPTGVRNVPGTTIEVTTSSIEVMHPAGVDVERPFADKLVYLREYQHDWSGWLANLKASWPRDTTDVLGVLKVWWEPLLALAPTLRGAIGSPCRIISGDADLLIDFPRGVVTAFAGEEHRFRLQVPRPLLEIVVRNRAVDWSNSLFLSCRFSAWRDGEFNEHLYNFFKSLSVERMRRAEEEAVRRVAPQEELSEEIELGEYLVQRYCPHRKADLSEFGVVEGDGIVCTLHGWKFSAVDGRCLNAEDRTLKVRRR